MLKVPPSGRGCGAPQMLPTPLHDWPLSQRPPLQVTEPFVFTPPPQQELSASQVVPVAVGLDHRNGEVAVHGWTEGSGVQLADALGWFPAAAAFVITDIARDGMLTGPDVEGLAAAAAAAPIPVIASGGVSSLDAVMSRNTNSSAPSAS